MAESEDRDKWLSEIDLATIFRLMKDNGTTEILYKVLPRNANSKNQVYLAPDLSHLGKIPSGEVTLHQSTTSKRGGVAAVYRSALDFSWISKDGRPCQAPDAKLIFYPQYPEVRFSGFLAGCSDPPSSLYDKRKRGEEPGRVLVFGVGSGKRIMGMTLPPESPAAHEIAVHHPRDAYGMFFILPIPGIAEGDGFVDLMHKLCVIHRRDWVPSRRLDKNGVLVPCNAPNCNGNTLESLLGIRSNGYSQPDFRGWEIKARSVPNSAAPSSSVVTLFTPEPTSGVYVHDGLQAFMRLYGYVDTMGRPDRLNFGGLYRANGTAHARTSLRMVLEGFNAEEGTYSPTGAIRLLDIEDREAMGWSFAKLIDHWKAKHAHAAFVPAQQRLEPERQYRFGRSILLGEGAEFGRFLAAVDAGKVYYDPGIKLEKVSTERPSAKRRSQFRVNSKDIPRLYESSRVVDACEQANC
ncbi:MAG: MvaI/BcnI restriction endonuclease family protein [Gammaproteobacteria bacterium]|nr:MAG: MvaI/BcnI restriction endonuclease family protein [Gammaproteobacteria bacterium]